MSYTIDTPLNQFRADITASQLRQAVAIIRPDSPLVNDCEAIIQAAKDNNIDPVYLLAHAALESAWGTSNFAKQRHNLYGYQAYTTDPNAAATFPDDASCIQFIAHFVSVSYLSPQGRWYGGAPTLRGMNVHYATSPSWATNIATVCNSIAGRIVTQSSVPSIPPEPVVSSNEYQVKVSVDALRVRNAPYLSGIALRQISRGVVVTVSHQIEGDNVAGNHIWLQLKGENAFIWSGGVEPISSTPALPPLTVNIQVNRSVTADKTIQYNLLCNTFKSQLEALLS